MHITNQLKQQLENAPFAPQQSLFLLFLCMQKNAYKKRNRWAEKKNKDTAIGILKR